MREVQVQVASHVDIKTMIMKLRREGEVEGREGG